VFLEAAACGLPVIAGDSGGAPEAASGATNCLVDACGVAGAMAELLGAARSLMRD
jgi:phosphatidylinositol alpha-1,6-mannosyltransferase